VWTSAGITAGIDLTLVLVEEHHGRATAMAVSKNLLLFLRRSGRQAQFSESLKRQEHEPARLRDITSHVLEHLDQSLPVERLARDLGMSSRSLARWCRDELGESPAALVRRLRIDQARRLLEETTLPLKTVASRSGLGDASTLWRIFAQHLGVTPAEYRTRFRSASLVSAQTYE
jgi:transcriptional regulator GlxA family with amidase domain